MEPENTNLNEFPDEIILEILQEVTNLSSLASFCLVSQRMARLCQDEGLWKYYFLRDFWNSEEKSSGKESLQPESWRLLYQKMTVRKYDSPISAGRDHVGTIDEKGNLYMWGKNGSGQLGDGTNNDSRTPIHIPFDSRVVSLSCSDFVTGIVTADGRVFIWGGSGNIKIIRRDDGRGGQVISRSTTMPQNPALTKIPLEMPIDGKAVKISLGRWEALILMTDGNIIRIDISGESIFSDKVIFPEPMIDIAIGKVKLVVSAKHKLYSILWEHLPSGNITTENETGIYGITTSNDKIYRLNEMDVSGVVSVSSESCFGDYTAAIKENGTLYFWKNNLLRTKPQVFSFGSPVISISVNGGVASVITQDLKLYMRGRNTSKQIAPQNESYTSLRTGKMVLLKNNVQSFVEIQLSTLPRYIQSTQPEMIYPKIRYATTGDAFTIAMTDEGVLLVWGLVLT